MFLRQHADPPLRPRRPSLEGHPCEDDPPSTSPEEVYAAKEMCRMMCETVYLAMYLYMTK
ncbi:unnamed protein product [Camellia sinensis]